MREGGGGLYLMSGGGARDETGQDFLDPTGKFQNHRRSTGWLTGF